MNAVVRARVNAKLIFRAGIGDYVCHSLSPGLLINCRPRDSEPCSTLTRVENHVPTGGDSNHPPVVTHFTPNFLTPVLPHPYRSSFRAIGWEPRTCSADIPRSLNTLSDSASCRFASLSPFSSTTSSQ